MVVRILISWKGKYFDRMEKGTVMRVLLNCPEAPGSTDKGSFFKISDDTHSAYMDVSTGRN